MFETKTTIYYHRVPLDILTRPVEEDNRLKFEFYGGLVDALNKFMMENQFVFQKKYVIIDYLDEGPVDEIQDN